MHHWKSPSQFICVSFIWFQHKANLLICNLRCSCVVIVCIGPFSVVLPTAIPFPFSLFFTVILRNYQAPLLLFPELVHIYQVPLVLLTLVSRCVHGAGNYQDMWNTIAILIVLLFITWEIISYIPFYKNKCPLVYSLKAVLTWSW